MSFCPPAHILRDFILLKEVLRCTEKTGHNYTLEVQVQKIPFISILQQAIENYWLSHSQV